jgi:4-carboxymuconolactone decarboxylase
LDTHAIDEPDLRKQAGEATCSTVYGRFYERLRVNIRELHPALDQWMIEEGYGKVLSRAPLDLARRELCIVAACAIARQDRQLHSHLHGAIHAGASAAVVSAALDTVAPLLDADDVARYQGLWKRVQGK